MNQDCNKYVDVTGDKGRLRSSQRHGPRPSSSCGINKLQQMLLGLILLTRREECSLGHFRIYIHQLTLMEPQFIHAEVVTPIVTSQFETKNVLACLIQVGE